MNTDSNSDSSRHRNKRKRSHVRSAKRAPKKRRIAPPPPTLHINIRVYTLADKKAIPWGGCVPHGAKMAAIAHNPNPQPIRLVLMYTDARNRPITEKGHVKDLQPGQRVCMGALDASSTGNVMYVHAMSACTPLIPGSPLFATKLHLNLG